MNFKIHAGTDGTWLQFRASNGKHAALRVEGLIDKQTSIIGDALRQWCADRQVEALTSPAPGNAASGEGKEDSPETSPSSSLGSVTTGDQRAKPVVSFTPGPWEHHVGLDYVSVKPSSPQANITDVAFVYGRYRRDAEANARLIAAAPELLAALNAIMKWYDAPDAPLSDLIGKSDEAIAMFERARNVVAKAEGRS